MEFHKLTFRGGPACIPSEILLDGLPLKGVTAFRLTSDVRDGMIRVSLDLFAVIEIDAQITALQLEANRAAPDANEPVIETTAIGQRDTWRTYAPNPHYAPPTE